MRNLTLANASSTQQGAIGNFGTLILEHCMLTNNHTNGVNGGAIDNYAVMHIPLPGSPAIDHGNNADCLDTDQRGKSRPVNGTCDIGAVERQLVDFSDFVDLPLVLR